MPFHRLYEHKASTKRHQIMMNVLLDSLDITEEDLAPWENDDKNRRLSAGRLDLDRATLQH